MVVVKNKTVYTYGDGDGIIIIVVAIYHLLYQYLDCRVKLTEEFVLHFQGASILLATSTSPRGEIHCSMLHMGIYRIQTN